MAPSPHPLAATLPALYAQDDFAQRICSALDEVLAPAIVLLDCFGAYLDPQTAPPDLLDWLIGWVGLVAAHDLPLERRRALLSRAAHLHSWRGTPQAIRELAELATGAPVQLAESGGSNWSQDVGETLPGSSDPYLVIRARADDGGALLTGLLALVVPAHLPWRLELT